MFGIGLGIWTAVVYVAGPVWSLADAAAGSLTLTNTNRDFTSTLAAWNSIRATLSKTSGKLYVEFEAVDTKPGSDFMIGLASAEFVSTSYLGTSSYSAGLTAGGPQYLSAGFSAASGACPATGTTTAGRILQLCTDFTGKVWIGEGNVYSGDPVAGTGQSLNFVPATVGALFPAMSSYAANRPTWRLKTKASEQTYLAPTGFTAWGG